MHARIATFVLAVVTLIGCAASTVTSSEPGATCNIERAGTCGADGGQLLVCSMGVYVIYSDCHGSNGCAVGDDQQAACDTSGNSLGARCAPESENKVRCDPAGATRVLRCVSGVLVTEVTCPGTTRCVFDGDAGALRCQ